MSGDGMEDDWLYDDRGNQKLLKGELTLEETIRLIKSLQDKIDHLTYLLEDYPCDLKH